MVFPKDTNIGSEFGNVIWQGFIATIPNNMIFKLAIYKSVNNILNERYGKNPLDITGPVMLGKIIFNFWTKEREKYSINPGIYKIEDKTINYILSGFNYIYNNNGQQIIQKKGNNIDNKDLWDTNNKNNENHYDNLWQEKKIYN